TGTIGVALRDLRQRLMAELNPNSRAMVDELREAHRATLSAPLQSGDHDAVFTAIEDAFGKEHCLLLRYSTPGKGLSERVVEPHLFWVHQGRPYLVAYCRSAQTFRKFAVQRVQSAEVLDEAFDRRVGFDPVDFIERGFGMLHGDVHTIRVEFSAEVAHLARERRWHCTQQVTPAENGSVVLSITAAGLPEIAAWVASFGGKARALDPPALVHAVRKLHARGLEAHPVLRDE
ncbi:MAG TPA: WYL domain-containing protein, partial [Polyangiaceae bacterium]